MNEDLFGEETARKRRPKAVLPVHVPTDQCPECGGQLERATVLAAALFRHGGYGATRNDTVDSCVDCHWTIHRSTSEQKP